VPITVRALLEMPHLSLELAAGQAGLDREIAWVHVAEVSDPTPWIEGGELILTTGLGLTDIPDEQALYLRRLALARAAGVVVVSHTAPPISAAMRATANDLDLPLLTTEQKQPFQAIAKLVYAANSNVQAERLVEHLRIYGVLRTAAANGISALELQQRLAEVAQVRLAVVREDGRPQFGAGEPDPRWAAARGALEALSGGARSGMYARLPDDGGSPGYVLQLTVPTASRVFLIAEGIEGERMPELVALHHIATVLATQVLAQRTERAIRHRVGADLLRELIDGHVGPSVAARLEALEVLGRQLVVLCVRAQERESDIAAEELHDVLLDHDLRALVAKRQGDVFVALPASPSTSEVARLVRAVAVDTFERRCAVSIGTPGDAEHVRTSFQQAVVAIEHALLAPDGVAMFSRIDAPSAWMPADPAAIRLLVDETIGPLIEYDREHHTDLMLTLNVYLRAAGSAQAADALHIHRNTLGYRLKRIEQVTSRRLTSMDDRFELWLGLRAHELRSRAPEHP
jgi:purine catabolism regulator